VESSYDSPETTAISKKGNSLQKSKNFKGNFIFQSKITVHLRIFQKTQIN